MKAKKEICYGIIPLTFRENYYEVFLVQHIKGSYWGFPKGHAEEKESPKEAAERELKEETGMTVVRYLPHPYLVSQYCFKRGEQFIDKTIHFYLAEVAPKYSCRSEEVVQGRWVPLKDFHAYVTFKEEEELFQKLITLLAG